jgi:heat shock protein 1/8
LIILLTPFVPCHSSIASSPSQNVSAADKTTGKSSKITITNDKGRLSKDDIERMVSEAEKYKEEDAEAAERITTRNGFESYTYNLRNSLQDDKLADKWQDDDKATLQTAVDEAISFLDSSSEASKQEFEGESIRLPSFISLYRAHSY